MKKLFIYKALWLLLLLPLFSGCNDSDDVQQIFTGKTWKLSYINYKDKGGMMGGFDEKSIKIFKENKNAYTITFTGVEENNLISGKLTGNVIMTNIEGTWTANGKDNQFKANIGNIKDSDSLGKAFIEGLTNATSYEGDTNNLFLYYKPNSSQQTLVLAFHIKN